MSQTVVLFHIVPQKRERPVLHTGTAVEEGHGVGKIRAGVTIHKNGTVIVGGTIVAQLAVGFVILPLKNRLIDETVLRIKPTGNIRVDCVKIVEIRPELSQSGNAG